MSGKTAPDNGAITVHVDVISWVNELVGGTGTGTHEFQERARPGETVRQVLKAFSERHPRLKLVLWDEHDREEIGPHIEIIVNDAILGVTHQLDSTLQHNDRITLAGQFIGG